VATGGSFNDLDQEQFCTSAAGVAPLSAHAVALMPNPAQDQVGLTSEVAGRVVVRDVQGREVYAARIQRGLNTWSVADWEAGVYVVEVMDEVGRRVVNRLVVDRR
jgi:hypothetical protein